MSALTLTLSLVGIFSRRVIAGFCLAALANLAAAAESVQALRYGVTLYHLYQQDYLETLTELMVAQELGQLGVHSEKAELLRGGVSLSYGMDLEAERIFRKLLASADGDVNRDRAWFYLAWMAWQRGGSSSPINSSTASANPTLADSGAR